MKLGLVGNFCFKICIGRVKAKLHPWKDFIYFGTSLFDEYIFFFFYELSSILFTHKRSDISFILGSRIDIKSPTIIKPNQRSKLRSGV